MQVKQLSTRVSIVRRSAGQSAVEKASYISRTPLHSDYDGRDYRPRAKEDLVHHEVSLPLHAPEEYSDPAVLWNAVEAVEKSKNAQLARMIKFTLPNDWSYEAAVEIVRDFIRRDFTDKGMCADWAVHDSVNPEGQRNLHVHVLLTMRPFKEDGTWDSKQRKVYLLDDGGNRIPGKNGKGWKCTTEKTTDWDSRENARLWRKDLCGTFNAVNEKLNIDERWEYRSFQEQGIDLIPTIHLGPSASALERKGIRTSRGDVNRDIRRRNALLMKAKQEYEQAAAMLQQVKQELLDSIADASSAVVEKAGAAAAVVRNALTEMVEKILSVFGHMLIDTQGKYIRRLGGREKLHSPEYMYRLVWKYGVQNERELYELETRLEKDLDKLDAARKKGAAPNRTSGTRSSAKSSSEAEKIRATHAELLTDLAVIESFDYSKHKLVMEIVRGRQPKSLLWDESSNDRQKENRSQKAASINGHSAASKLRNAKIISREASR